MRDDKGFPLYGRLSRDEELQGVRLIVINDGAESRSSTLPNSAPTV